MRTLHEQIHCVWQVLTSAYSDVCELIVFPASTVTSIDIEDADRIATRQQDAGELSGREPQSQIGTRHADDIESKWSVGTS